MVGGPCAGKPEGGVASADPAVSAWLQRDQDPAARELGLVVRVQAVEGGAQCAEYGFFGLLVDDHDSLLGGRAWAGAAVCGLALG